MRFDLAANTGRCVSACTTCGRYSTTKWLTQDEMPRCRPEQDSSHRLTALRHLAKKQCHLVKPVPVWTATQLAAAWPTVSKPLDHLVGFQPQTSVRPSVDGPASASGGPSLPEESSAWCGDPEDDSWPAADEDWAICDEYDFWCMP